MRRAIVHIGLPRTATTTLQRILSDRREALADRGILYPTLTPRSASEPHLSHQYLGEALDGRRPRRERKELLEVLDNALKKTEADVVLVSYEGLSMIRGSGAARHLTRIFQRRGFQMETLVTVKPQGAFVNSLYTHATQFLKEPRPFGMFLDTTIESPRLDYERISRSWRAASDGRIRAVALRPPGTNQPMILRILDELSLLDRVQDLLTESDLSLVENPSPGPYTVEVARQLRLRGLHTGFGRAAREATRHVEQLARSSGLDHATFRGLTPAQARRVESKYAARNEMFARTVWSGGWSAHVAPENTATINELAARPLDRTEAAEIDRLVRAACMQFGVGERKAIFPGFRPIATAPRNLLRHIRRVLP